jgi:two-component system sensor histidine kinase BaeS
VRVSWRHAGLGARMFVAIAMVIVAGAATLLVVAVFVAPVVFRQHLEDAGVSSESPLASHIDEGFTVALVTSITAAVLAASVIAVGVAALVSRRISRPVGVAAATAGRLADGDYAARMTTPALGPELDHLAASINVLAERLESAEQHRIRLLNDLAHELRTPLAALEATVEAVVDGVLPADAATLRTLTDQTGRLTRLTRDLPAVSRADEHAFRLDRREVDVSEVAAAAVTAQRARYSAAGVGLATADVGSASAWVDPDRVTEILDQLLDNALRHCAAGDAVTLTVRREEGRVCVVVTDTGRGFDPGVAEDLFDRFYRSGDPTDAHAGSGVGLTIARSLAEAHHGTLTAASPGPLRGATFTLTIPDSHQAG